MHKSERRTVPSLRRFFLLEPSAIFAEDIGERYKLDQPTAMNIVCMIMIAISVQRVVLNAGAKIRRLWSKFRCSSSCGADDDSTDDLFGFIICFKTRHTTLQSTFY